MCVSAAQIYLNYALGSLSRQTYDMANSPGSRRRAELAERCRSLAENATADCILTNEEEEQHDQVADCILTNEEEEQQHDQVTDCIQTNEEEEQHDQVPDLTTVQEALASFNQIFLNFRINHRSRRS